MRYKIWRTVGSFADAVYVMIVADPPEGPATNWEAVPEQIRRIGIWWGYKGGRLTRLKPVYRQVLRHQGFVVLAGLDQAADVETPPRRRIRLRRGEMGSW